MHLDRLADAHARAAAGKDAAAIALYAALLADDPGLADAANNLGVLLRRCGDQAGAIRRYRQALAAEPAHADAMWNLGRALVDAGEPDEAFLLLRRAAAQRPGWARTHMLGRACQMRGDLDGAEAAFRRALAEQPDAVETLNNLASTLQAKGKPHAALNLLDRAVALAPDHADIRFNRSLLLLLLGRHDEGWREHEWRWRAPGFTSPRRQFESPPWQGQPLPGGTLLVHWEQGLGDTLQFIRFLAAARRRVTRLVLEVQPALVRVLQGIEGADAVMPSGAPLPACDAHAALLSLPVHLGAEASVTAPYLRAPPALAEAWQRRTAAPGLRVGLVWAGNPHHGNDRNRSIAPGLLAPLLDLPGVSWFSLQVGPQRLALQALRLGERVVDLVPELGDFAETAAALTSLDLLVCVDTAVAHLAGALGCPAWVLLPFAPDWRWGCEGAQSPLYPSLRLFRQAVPGQWQDSLKDVASGLTALTDLSQTKTTT